MDQNSLFKPKKHHVIIQGFKVVAMHPDGKAYGFDRGRRVFVSGGIPGETVTISMEKRQMGYFMAEILRIEQASPHRVIPFCKHAGLCGGCNWQHISYTHQLNLKNEIISEALIKQQIDFMIIEPATPSPFQIHFRNRTEYTFSTSRWFYESEGKITDPKDRLAVGFNPEGKADRVIDIEECWLQPDPAHQLSREAKQLAIAHQLEFWNPKQKTGLIRSIEFKNNTFNEWMCIIGFAYFDERIAIYLTDLQGLFPANTLIYYTIFEDVAKAVGGTTKLFTNTNAEISEYSGKLKFRLHPDGFYQTNPLQAAKLFEIVYEFADPSPNDFVYDLYSGAGTIALHLAQTAKQVMGIEANQNSIEDAHYNALMNGIENVKFIQGDVLETFTIDFINAHPKPSIIILDPPRSGTLIEIKKSILYAKPQTIVYVSCNPAALAKDLKMLTTDYIIARIQPVDMFPHSHHIETVVKLTRKETLQTS